MSFKLPNSQHNYTICFSQESEIQNSQKKAKSTFSENPITFLVATDLHLGHKEKHPILKNDPFEAFEETLSIANSQKVDFVLLGGDFFDEADPSCEVQNKSLEILGNNIFGNKKIAIEIETADIKGNVYEDQNISLPIFMIHGNHDYPCHNNFSSVEIIDTVKYVINTKFFFFFI